MWGSGQVWGSAETTACLGVLGCAMETVSMPRWEHGEVQALWVLGLRGRGLAGAQDPVAHRVVLHTHESGPGEGRVPWRPSQSPGQGPCGPAESEPDLRLRSETILASRGLDASWPDFGDQWPLMTLRFGCCVTVALSVQTLSPEGTLNAGWSSQEAVVSGDHLSERWAHLTFHRREWN